MNRVSNNFKIGSENRMYKEQWESLILNNNRKSQHLAFIQVVSLPKEYSLKRYYYLKHKDKFKKYDGDYHHVFILG